jgi:hypothetical protein
MEEWFRHTWLGCHCAHERQGVSIANTITPADGIRRQGLGEHLQLFTRTVASVTWRSYADNRVCSEKHSLCLGITRESATKRHVKICIGGKVITRHFVVSVFFNKRNL